MQLPHAVYAGAGETSAATAPGPSAASIAVSWFPGLLRDEELQGAECCVLLFRAALFR